MPESEVGKYMNRLFESGCHSCEMEMKQSAASCKISIVDVKFDNHTNYQESYLNHPCGRRHLNFYICTLTILGWLGDPFVTHSTELTICS